MKWEPSNQVDQLCKFRTGWNWISLYVQPEEGKNDLENVFGHSKVFNTIKSKEGFAMNIGSQWTSTGLETVDIGKLYKVKVKNDVNHNIVGTMIDTRTATQTIYPGWNWIGPLSIYNLSLEEAFADLQPTRGDIIKSKTQVAFYNGYKWEGDLTAVFPGMGYYYQSCNEQPVTFHYPTIDASYDDASAIMMLAPSAFFNFCNNVVSIVFYCFVNYSDANYNNNCAKTLHSIHFFASFIESNKINKTQTRTTKLLYPEKTPMASMMFYIFSITILDTWW